MFTINDQQQASFTYILDTNRSAARGNGSKLHHRAQEITSSQQLTLLQFSDNNIVSYVAGSKGESYRVCFKSNGERQCGCRFHRDNDADCKHLIAVAIKLEEKAAE